jgi:hypothetical protein
MKVKFAGKKHAYTMSIISFLGLVITCAPYLSSQIGYPTSHSNFDERKVGAYQLPDLLTTSSGVHILDPRSWYNLRRPEIDRLLEEQEYGRSPAAPKSMRFEVVEPSTPALDGLAIRKQIAIHLTADDWPTLHLLLYTPAKSTKPSPVLLNLSFTSNANTVDDPGIKAGTVWGPNHTQIIPPQPTSARRIGVIPVQRLLQEGYGFATFYYGDVEPDSADGLPYGIRARYLSSKGTQPAANEWGAIAAWAWGLSRAQDYLETDPQVDAKHGAIIGVSRLGKTVMWAGAHDTRFALVIASCSGEGGASLSHRDYGETVADMNKGFAYQFAANYQKYGSDPAHMPFDAHMLVALIAPRPLLLQTGSLDLWSDPKGEFLAEVAADPVYHLLGTDGLQTDQWPPPGLPIVTPLGYFMHDGGHGTLPDDWQVLINFLNIQLRSKINTTTSAGLRPGVSSP